MTRRIISLPTCLAALILVPAAARADLLLQYDFTGDSLNPTSTAPGISGSALTRDAGETITFGPGNPTPGASSTGWADGYYQVTIFNNTPTIYDITGVSVDLQSPQGLFGPFDAYITDDNGFLLTGAPLSTAFATDSASGFNEMLNPGSSRTFRLNGIGASNPNAALNIDNFKFTGAPVPVQPIPEPSSLALLAAVAAGLAAAHARKTRRRLPVGRKAGSFLD